MVGTLATTGSRVGVAGFATWHPQIPVAANVHLGRLEVMAPVLRVPGPTGEKRTELAPPVGAIGRGN